MRLYCDIDGLDKNWIEISDAWTRREYKDMVDAESAEFFDILHAKATACHIETSGGVIEDPADITEDSIDDVDMRLVGFIGSVLVSACVRLRSLGNASARASSDGTAQLPPKD